MNYDPINDRYNLGLGLYFTITNNHKDFPGGYICRSNIPKLDFYILNTIDKEAGISEVEAIIKACIDISDK